MQNGEAWDWADAGFVSATELLSTGRKRHRVVEKLPDGGWDWSVWTSGGTQDVLYGCEKTINEALTAAKLASIDGSCGETVGRSATGLRSARRFQI